MADAARVDEGRVAVIGGGGLGTAIAAGIARSGHHVTLLCRTAAQSDAIRTTGINHRYFPGLPLPSGIATTADLADVTDVDVVFLATPITAIEEYALTLAPIVSPAMVVVNMAKGLHARHLSTARLFAGAMPRNPYLALKGAVFARPLLLAEWSGMTLGHDPRHADAAARVAALLDIRSLLVERFPSAEAVDVVSALKGVYGIFLGLLASTGASENTMFLGLTFVFREMSRILSALGLDPRVMMSFAGVGDTLLTGLCDTSRSRTWGLMIGKGAIDLKQVADAFDSLRTVAILRGHLGDAPTPLLDAVVAVMDGGAAPSSIVRAFGRRAA